MGFLIAGKVYLVGTREYAICWGWPKSQISIHTVSTGFCGDLISGLSACNVNIFMDL